MDARQPREFGSCAPDDGMPPPLRRVQPGVANIGADPDMLRPDAEADMPQADQRLPASAAHVGRVTLPTEVSVDQDDTSGSLPTNADTSSATSVVRPTESETPATPRVTQQDYLAAYRSCAKAVRLGGGSDGQFRLAADFPATEQTPGTLPGETAARGQLNHFSSALEEVTNAGRAADDLSVYAQNNLERSEHFAERAAHGSARDAALTKADVAYLQDLGGLLANHRTIMYRVGEEAGVDARGLLDREDLPPAHRTALRRQADARVAQCMETRGLSATTAAELCLSTKVIGDYMANQPRVNPVSGATETNGLYGVARRVAAFANEILAEAQRTGTDRAQRW